MRGAHKEGNNTYSSDQFGRAERGEYQRALRRLGNYFPLKPFLPSESWRRKRQGMRRISDTGK
jgi:hypothetical protein